MRKAAFHMGLITVPRFPNHLEHSCSFCTRSARGIMEAPLAKTKLGARSLKTWYGVRVRIYAEPVKSSGVFVSDRLIKPGYLLSSGDAPAGSSSVAVCGERSSGEVCCNVQDDVKLLSTKQKLNLEQVC